MESKESNLDSAKVSLEELGIDKEELKSRVGFRPVLNREQKRRKARTEKRSFGRIVMKYHNNEFKNDKRATPSKGRPMINKTNGEIEYVPYLPKYTFYGKSISSKKKA